MGEVTDMMLDGTLCEGCGVFLNDDAPGYPCRCKSCRAEAAKDFLASCQPPKAKAKCAVCGRKVKANGLMDHMRDAHQIRGAA